VAALAATVLKWFGMLPFGFNLEKVSPVSARSFMEKTAHNLPNSVIIAGPSKIADMLCISSGGLCGEDDFKYLREKEAEYPG
jgi:hypothetical protein